MASERITITLPERLAKRVRQQAKKTKRPVSKVIADAIQAEEAAVRRQLLIEGYIATRDENRRIAEEFWPIAGETLPDEDWSDYEEAK